MNLLHIPKVRMVLVLAVLTVLAIFSRFSVDLIVRLILIVGAALTSEFVLWRMRGVTPFLPSAGVVTALIVFLLSDPSSSMLWSIFAVVVGVAGKQLFRSGGRHTLNPAAAGLFVSSFLGNTISWWGTNGTIALIIILGGASFVSLYTMRQYAIVIPFVALTIVFSLLLTGSIEAAFGQLSVGAFWFFTLVMLPEPITAAHTQPIKPLYAGLVAFLSFIVARFGVDPLIASLLIGNATVRLIEQRRSA